MTETATVVVRSKDRASTIEAALRSLREQTVSAEIVLVDSGSRDATVDLARPYVDRILQIAPQDFTFGGALNLGARNANGSVVFALSSHCVAHSRTWIEDSLSHYRDPEVAGTCGWTRDPAGAPLDQPRFITFDDVHSDPHAGFSNHASSWRKSVWVSQPFDDHLPACEDLEWMWRVMLEGWKVVADPNLVVDSGHRRSAGARALWRREYLEHRTIAELMDFPVMTWRELARTWWSSFPWPSPHPHWQRRLSVERNIELLAGFIGDRAGRAHRDDRTIRLAPDLYEPRCAP